MGKTIGCLRLVNAMWIGCVVKQVTGLHSQTSDPSDFGMRRIDVFDVTLWEQIRSNSLISQSVVSQEQHVLFMETVRVQSKQGFNICLFAARLAGLALGHRTTSVDHCHFHYPHPPVTTNRWCKPFPNGWFMTWFYPHHGVFFGPQVVTNCKVFLLEPRPPW